MQRTEKYYIGPRLLGDIRRVVGQVESQTIGSAVTRIPTRLQEMQQPSQGLRRATFNGAWNKGATKTIYFHGTDETATAHNIMATVDMGCGEDREAFVASVDGVWQLVAAECA